MNQKISVIGVFKDTYQVIKENGSFIYYLFLPVIVVSVLRILFFPESYSFTVEGKMQPALAFYGGLFDFLLGLTLWTLPAISLLKFFIQGKKDSWSDWKKYLRLLPKYIGVSLLQMLMIIAGLVFFVVPGIYLALRYAFVGYRTLEHPTETVGNLFRTEALATKGNRLSMFLIGLMAFILIIIVLILLGTLFMGFEHADGNPVVDIILEAAFLPLFMVLGIITYLQLNGRRKMKEEIPEKEVESVEEDPEILPTPEPVL